MEIIENKKTEYISLIRDFCKNNNRVPRQRDFKGKSQSIAKVFGSWNNAIRTAGFEVVRDFSPTKARLRNSLLEFYAKHKRAPKTKECTKAKGLYDHKTYIKFFEVDNWAEVLEKVGLDRFLKYSKLTQNKERAREEIVAFIKNEKITNCLDYKRLAKMKGLPSLAFIGTEYGGWETLLKIIGLRRELTKEMIVKAIRNYHEKNGKSPAAAVLAKRLKTTVDSITGITGNYNNLLNELGLPLNKQLYERNKLSKDQLKRLYIEFSRKNGFLNGAPRLVLNEFTDVPNASVFIRRFGSMSDLRRACGFIPFNEYNGYSRKEIIELLRKKYLSLRRPLKTEEINNDKDLPAVSTILRYLELPTLEKVWKFIKNDIQGIG